MDDDKSDGEGPTLIVEEEPTMTVLEPVEKVNGTSKKKKGLLALQDDGEYGSDDDKDDDDDVGGWDDVYEQEV